MELQQYWLILKRRWLPATFVFVVVSAIARVMLIRQEPIYEAQGKLRFKPADMTSLIGIGEEGSELNPLVEGTNPMTPEMEVIRSVPIVETTIKKLNLRNPIDRGRAKSGLRSLQASLRSELTKSDRPSNRHPAGAVREPPLHPCRLHKIFIGCPNSSSEYQNPRSAERTLTH